MTTSSTQSTQDVLAEVWAIKDSLSASHGHSLKATCSALCAEQQKHPDDFGNLGVSQKQPIAATMNQCRLFQVIARISVSAILLSHPLCGYAQLPNDDHTLWTAKWSHDGSRFAVGGVRELWVFDSATLARRSLLPEVQKPSPGDANASYMAITSVAWDPSDNLLAVSSQGPGGDAKGIYDLVSGRRVALEGAFGRGVSWSPKGDALANASDGNLKMWSKDGTLLHEVPRYKEGKGLTGVAWRPSGDRIVTVGARITLHDGQGKPIRQMMHRPEAQERLQLLLCVEWHPSGDFFAVGDYGTEVDDPVLQFWSADGNLLKSISLKGDSEIRNISWNHDGSLLASASDKLRVWTKDGKLKYESKSPDLLWGVDWHPKGDKILTTSIEGRVTLWSSTAEVVKEIVLPHRLQPLADGAANGSEPIRSETNRMSLPAGSRR